MFVKRCGSSERERSRTRRITAISSESVSAGAGTAPARSYCSPLWTSRVASPPSSRIMFGPPPSGQRSTCSVHHQYSSSVSPFQAYTGAPRGSSGVPSGPTTTAAAAWSWVEKMLQEAQRTSAPSATSVSISTAVCTVMCSDPVMRAPVSGLLSWYWRRIAISPGISCSASSISLRPKGARPRSLTRKSAPVVVVVMASLFDSRGLKQPLVFLLLEPQPLGGCDVLRSLWLGMEPAVDRFAQLGLALEPRGKRDFREADLEPLQQLLERPQPLQLAGPVDAIARARASRRQQPGPLHVPEHARRPPGRLRRLVDRQRLHPWCQRYHACVKVCRAVSPGRAPPLTARAGPLARDRRRV